MWFVVCAAKAKVLLMDVLGLRTGEAWWCCLRGPWCCGCALSIAVLAGAWCKRGSVCPVLVSPTWLCGTWGWGISSCPCCPCADPQPSVAHKSIFQPSSCVFTPASAMGRGTLIKASRVGTGSPLATQAGCVPPSTNAAVVVLGWGRGGDRSACVFAGSCHPWVLP